MLYSAVAATRILILVTIFVKWKNNKILYDNRMIMI